MRLSFQQCSPRRRIQGFSGSRRYSARLRLLSGRILLRLFEMSGPGLELTWAPPTLVWKNEKAEIIASDQGLSITPSYVTFTEEETLVADSVRVEEDEVAR